MSPETAVKYRMSRFDLAVLNLDIILRQPACTCVPLFFIFAAIACIELSRGRMWYDLVLLFGFMVVTVPVASILIVVCSFGLLHALLDMRSVLCEHVLTVGPSGLLEDTRLNSSTFSWEGIVRVVRRLHRTIIYTSAISGFVVPDSAFDSPGAATTFFDAAAAYVESAKLAASVAGPEVHS